MLERIGEMHGREVISVLDGSRIGYLGDIPWSAVKPIGEDAVLVDHIPVKRTPKRSFLQNFFENG